MKKAICAAATAILAVGVFAMRAGSQAKTSAAFDQLKALVGTWEGSSGDGQRFTATIRTVSNGTAVEETSNSATASEMITLYTPDGDKVALTHYCSMGNQPRMETSAVGSNAKQFDFAYIGATNLASDSDAHMHHVVLQIADSDHFSETWTMLANGQEINETFHFVRKKT
jgi:hypothetical protein